VEVQATTTFNVPVQVETASFTITATMTFTTTVTMSGSGIVLSSATAVVTFQATLATVSSSTFSGLGTTEFSQPSNGLMSSSGNTWQCPHRCTGGSGAARRTAIDTLVVHATCGDSFADLSLSSGTALLAYVNCTLASNTAYSSSAGATTFSSGSFLIFDQVTSSARPLYMGSLSAASDLRLEVISTDASTPLSVTLAEYALSGTCITAFANTSIDGCPSNATCEISGGADSSNSSQCLITYTQTLNVSDSNDAWYGLFGLLALPVIVVAALALKAVMRADRGPSEMAELDMGYPEPYGVYEGYLEPDLYVLNSPASLEELPQVMDPFGYVPEVEGAPELELYANPYDAYAGAYEVAGAYVDGAGAYDAPAALYYQ